MQTINNVNLQQTGGIASPSEDAYRFLQSVKSGECIFPYGQPDKDILSSSGRLTLGTMARVKMVGDGITLTLCTPRSGEIGRFCSVFNCSNSGYTLTIRCPGGCTINGTSYVATSTAYIGIIITAISTTEFIASTLSPVV